MVVLPAVIIIPDWIPKFIAIPINTTIFNIIPLCASQSLISVFHANLGTETKFHTSRLVEHKHDIRGYVLDLGSYCSRRIRFQSNGASSRSGVVLRILRQHKTVIVAGLFTVSRGVQAVCAPCWGYRRPFYKWRDVSKVNCTVDIVDDTFILCGGDECVHMLIERIVLVLAQRIHKHLELFIAESVQQSVGFFKSRTSHEVIVKLPVLIRHVCLFATATISFRCQYRRSKRHEHCHAKKQCDYSIFHNALPPHSGQPDASSALAPLFADCVA